MSRINTVTNTNATDEQLALFDLISKMLQLGSKILEFKARLSLQTARASSGLQPIVCQLKHLANQVI